MHEPKFPSPDAAQPGVKTENLDRAKINEIRPGPSQLLQKNFDFSEHK